MTPGVYQLCLRLPRATRIKVGKLGTFLFPAGIYVYTGSALNGLEQRLARHQRREKKLHWHIDYLLRHAQIVRVRTQTVGADVRRRATRSSAQRHSPRYLGAYKNTASPSAECAWNAQTLRLPGAGVIAPGFGSSDCDCPSHLVYLRNEEPWTSTT